ncbi:RNA polymerase sigma factor [Kitasatospora sp. NPDC058965]|uniref:RNA polymerase sigma factor n=1 Tax=Kitasatospora sp. NPDC058965 TaxID=3346682 RepID=UPI00368810FE
MRGYRAALVRAAQQGDVRALEVLVADHLPLVHAFVGRALDAPADTDDVVQETMLQLVRDVRKLRNPEAFRSWLIAIAAREVRRHWRLRRGSPPTTGLEAIEETTGLADPAADFVDLAITALSLSAQRREVAEATRWLDAGDRQLLSLWWLEVAGRLTRAELAAAMEQPAPHLAVRVQRMKARLDVARAAVRALRAEPRCAGLRGALRGWDGRPDGLWRKRIARHLRSCPDCDSAPLDLVPAEQLLTDAALLTMPPVLLIRAAAEPAPSGSGPSGPPGAAAPRPQLGARGGERRRRRPRPRLRPGRAEPDRRPTRRQEAPTTLKLWSTKTWCGQFTPMQCTSYSPLLSCTTRSTTPPG